MAQHIMFSFENDDGDEIDFNLPAKYEVCARCQGHGTHLNPSIGEHAYTSEEFHESFDEEQAEEYFKHGGIYDVTCEGCGGKRVVLVPDVDMCRSDEQKAALAAYDRKLEADASYERECAHERRMGY